MKQGYPRNIPEERFLTLAAYEDTGLTPMQVRKIKKENIRLKKYLEEAMESIRPGCDICSRDGKICAIADFCDFKWLYSDEIENILGGKEK